MYIQAEEVSVVSIRERISRSLFLPGFTFPPHGAIGYLVLLMIALGMPHRFPADLPVCGPSKTEQLKLLRQRMGRALRGTPLLAGDVWRSR